MVNSVAGGGSLISFPALLAVGYPSVTANIPTPSHCGPAMWAATRPIAESSKDSDPARSPSGRRRVAGGIAGSVLLLTTPASAFKRAVPWLILLACALFALQPLASPDVLESGGHGSKEHRSLGLHFAVFFAAVYGAYFGAGLGIVLLAILGLAIADSLQKLNGLKQVLSVVDQLRGSRRLQPSSAPSPGPRWPSWPCQPRRRPAGGGFARRLSPIVLRVVVTRVRRAAVSCILLARQ